MAIVIERLYPNYKLRVQAAGCQASLFELDDMASAEAEAKRLHEIFKEPIYMVLDMGAWE